MKPILLKLASLIISITIVSSIKATKLNERNFYDLTSGKSIFVKFCSKSCAICQEITTAWDELADAWEDDEIGLIGEVDCDAESSFCNDHKIVGTPTLLYGDRYDLQEYSGDKSFRKLNSFAKNVLIPICSPNNVNACNQEDKARIEEWMKLPIQAVDNMINALVEDLENAKLLYKQEKNKLQAVYDDMNNAFTMKKARLRNNVKLIESVKRTVRNGN